MRLLSGQTDPHWDSPAHFFGGAAEAMRRILINRARDKKRLKRDGGRQRANLDELALAIEAPSEELIALSEALDALQAEDPKSAELVKLRFFAGLTQGQAAEALGLPRRSADRLWTNLRACEIIKLERRCAH